MSAAERTRLGAMAKALLAGDAPSPRAAMLGRTVAGQERAAVPLQALADAPAWLALPQAERHRLGHRAALAALGPELGRSIDGKWLGGLAQVAGEAALDWAATVEGATVRLPRFEADALDAVASNLLRSAVPIALRDYAAPERVGTNFDHATAAAALATALESVA